MAHRKIIDQGIQPSLRFMDTDSGRTSSEERSSDDRYETKKPEGEIIKVGLYQRHKASNMTSNPLLKNTHS